MTCNCDWPEIVERLRPGQTAHNIPVIVDRVFKARLKRLLRILNEKFGDILYLLHIIEFQKRVFPHAHIVAKVFLPHANSHFQFLNSSKVHPDIPLQHIDDIIKAELPTDNPRLRQKIKKFMTHPSDHLTRETSRCRKGNRCIYGFPKPITPETHIDEDGRVHFRR
jgi:hypothetical protein